MKIKIQLDAGCSTPLGCDRPLVLQSVSNMPTSTLVANEQQNFGNITVSLKSLGNTSYRIEWYSRMTGATTSIAKLGKDNYGVFRKWAENKKLPEVAHSFTKRKSALVHFLNNVDIIRASDSIMNEAKNYCLTLFSKQEDVHIPANHKFARYRLQGAIGQPVIVKPKTTSDYIMAEGILLQLIGDSSEIQLTDFGDLVNRRPVQKFPNRQVFMK